jgi:hypothetical protein
MSTNSSIALEFADGSIGQVYCHWDGYIDHNGKILLDNYSDPFQLQKLIDLGDLSSLAPEIGEKHDFNSREHSEWCMFYGRDRGERGIEADFYETFDQFCASGDWQQYNYILRRDGNWYVATGDYDWTLLKGKL